MDHPTVGRIVHYSDSTGHGPFAAIITRVVDDHFVDLTVFQPGGNPYPASRVPGAEHTVAGWGWSWPPRAPASQSLRT